MFLGSRYMLAAFGKPLIAFLISHAILVTLAMLLVG
jgi:hypothetical protein